MRLRIETGRRAGFQTMAEIAAGDERDRPLYGCDRLSNAVAEAQVIFIRKKAVAERDYFSIPTVALQEVERHRRPVIKIGVSDSQSDQIVLLRRASNLGQQVIIERCLNLCFRRAEH